MDTTPDYPVKLHDELLVEPVRTFWPLPKGIASLKPTLGHHQIPAEPLNGDDSLDELHGDYREPEVHRERIVDHQSTPEMPTQPPPPSHEHGECAFGHSEERDMDPSPSPTAHANEWPVGVAGEFLEFPGEFLMDTVRNKSAV